MKDLHAAIINIPCAFPDSVDMSLDCVKRSYRLGHRDARHAAAELVLAVAPAPQERMLTDAEIDTVMRSVYSAGNHGRNLERAFARAVLAARGAR